MARFTTHFGFQSTAAEVIAGVDLTGRKAIVTGGAAGVGAATVRALAGAGAAVTMAVRRVDVAEPVAAELRRSTSNQAIDIMPLDLSDLRSVKAFTDAWEGPLDILVNNAGIMAVPELERTPQGFELQFGTNFLGHFALTIGLHTALAAANGARVVSVSSTGHLFSPVVFDDLNFDFVPYTPIGAYGQSKTAAALLAVGITQRWADNGIRSNTLHPGAIATGLQKYTGGRLPIGVRRWSKGPPRRCCWQHHLFLRAPAVSISRTATRLSRSQSGPATSRVGMLDMRSIRRTPNGCGIYP
ncbi:SDR family NAD(P)-dependent oxidoreductase [Bradyrhizobium sp. CSA207]|uniref:SDR family NAD(P)-dependent oxidoreductase n=1 Tax=Bradyrhizobium sp. CSA207 TaxID=2698826 RepID=UPI003182DAC8